MYIYDMYPAVCIVNTVRDLQQLQKHFLSTYLYILYVMQHYASLRLLIVLSTIECRFCFQVNGKENEVHTQFVHIHYVMQYIVLRKEWKRKIEK